MSNSIGHLLRHLRANSNLTIREMADKLGLSSKHVSELETGKIEADPVELNAYAKFFALTHRTTVAHGVPSVEAHTPSIPVFTDGEWLARKKPMEEIKLQLEIILHNPSSTYYTKECAAYALGFHALLTSHRAPSESPHVNLDGIPKRIVNWEGVGPVEVVRTSDLVGAPSGDGAPGWPERKSQDFYAGYYEGVKSQQAINEAVSTERQDDGMREASEPSASLLNQWAFNGVYTEMDKEAEAFAANFTSIPDATSRGFYVGWKLALASITKEKS